MKTYINKRFFQPEVGSTSTTTQNNFPPAIVTKYISPTPGQFPIIAITPYIHSEKDKDDKSIESPRLNDFENLVECGFNAFQIGISPIVLQKILSVCQDLNLVAIGGPSNMYGELYALYTKGESQCLAYLDFFKSTPKLTGWFIFDEPQYSNWEAPTNLNNIPEDKRIEMLQDTACIKHNTITPDCVLKRNWVNVPFYYNLVRKNEPNRLVYLNLDASDTNIVIGEGNTYATYLDKIENWIGPMVWSYDYYPFFIESGKITCKTDKFYEMLTLFRNISLKTGNPFWAFCLCTKYSEIRPVPTASRIRFEAFNALAYGAQGIIYWHYAYRDDFKDYGDYITPIDADGNKTQVWYNVHAVNLEIRKYQDVFLGCSVKELDHVIQITKHMEEGPIDLISPSGLDGIVLSQITNNSFNYIVIVNKNPFQDQEVLLQFNDSPSIRNTSLMTDNLMNLDIRISNIFQKFTLESGSYAIIRWK